MAPNRLKEKMNFKGEMCKMEKNVFLIFFNLYLDKDKRLDDGHIRTRSRQTFKTKRDVDTNFHSFNIDELQRKPLNVITG